MAEKLTERVALTISHEMLECLRRRIRKTGRTLLGEIRFLIQQGLTVEQGVDLDTRVKALEAENQMIKEVIATYGPRPIKKRA